MLRLPTDDERQMASLVLLDKTLSAVDRLTARRIERGDPMPAEDLDAVRELGYRSAARANTSEGFGHKTGGL